MDLTSNKREALVLISFFSLDRQARAAMLRSLQKRHWIVRSPNWRSTKHSMLQLTDIAVELLDSHLPVPPADQYLPGELQALLMAMMALPDIYEYIWLDDPEEGLTGPASRLWRLVERIAREILNELNEKRDCSGNELQAVADKFVSARVAEKAAEEDRTRAIKKALAQKRRRK